MSPETQLVIAGGFASSLLVPYGLIRCWDFVRRILTGAL